MENIKKMLHVLLETTGSHAPLLQQINEALLKDYQLNISSGLQILPKEVEIYYVNRKAKHPYVDSNMHCMLDPKTDAEIWQMQSGRFGQLYFHRKGLGGVDVCLSDSDHFALCCTIKAAEINGEECWSSLKVRNVILEKICAEEGVLPDVQNKQKMMNRMNEKKSLSVLAPREYPITGYVYHLHRRGLRRRDRNVLLPLRSFVDLWNKKLVMGNVQKLNLYMNAHPQANILEVLREHNFRYIPFEVKIRYNMDRKVKLYD